MQKERNEIQKILLCWYKKNGRHGLPWRGTHDLYKITVSEVMLQQTNVPKVIEKYKEFIKQFPSWEKLAGARQSSVIKLWQGLGYNRRALYLYRMAKIVVKKYGGKLPTNSDKLAQLPGMGPYTRNAVLVFGRNKDLIACDVNIDRILRRWHGEKDLRNEIEEIAWEFLPQRRSRDWHSAMMDFASMICTKRSPQCLVCPLKEMCVSYPNPKDFIAVKKKEPGRAESGKHIPRRIYRGRIVEALRMQIFTTNALGKKIKKDWDGRKDKKWLESLLTKLSEEGMIVEEGGKRRDERSRWRLR